MFWTKTNVSMRKMVLSVTVLGLAAVGLIFGSQFYSTAASNASATLGAPVTFPANAGTLGAVPDGPAGGTVCGDFGAPRDVTFTVSGVSAPLTDVRVSLSMTHTWVGDMEASLLAPGGAPSALLFKQTGGTTATACGDDSDMAGPYVFFDTAPASPTFWNAATTAGSAVPVAAGSYRATAALTGTTTTITPAFSGLTTGQINGTWTLRLRDGGEGDLGNVTAASLILDGSVAPPTGDAPVDFDADGRTDYVVRRNVGGGASGQVRWFYNLNAGGPTVALDWGLATDFFISEDFDNDNKDDVAVWRPGSATVAAFYILNSATNTARVEAFGQSGDDPTVVDDYNNDGSADLAVYRAGASAGLQSTWYYRTTANGPVTFVNWGQNGDFPAPGDYDDDGSADFVVQRNFGGGQAAFWRNLSTAPDDIVVFGTPTDVIVPGDYDGDGKIDVAVARGISGVINWFWRPSGGGADQQVQFGASASDELTQGDYDGDGKTDQAVWRNGVFWVRSTVSGTVSNFTLGAGGDYPVANFNTH